MKKLILIASFLIGAIAVNAQTTPLVFKTSAGATTSAAITNGVSSILYADVTNLGSSSVTGVGVITKVFGTYNSNIIPVVSNDGTNFTPIKNLLNTVSFLSVTGGTYTISIHGYDTVLRGTGAQAYLLGDTAATTFAYKFPTGYRYVGFKAIGGATTNNYTFTAKGLAK